MNGSSLFLPNPAELLLKASRPHQLCCFAALSAKRKAAVMTEEELDGPVLVYQPHSSLFPSPAHSITSLGSAESANSSLTAGTAVELLSVRRAYSAETPEVRLRSTPSVATLGERSLSSAALAGVLTPGNVRPLLPLASPSRLSIDATSLPGLVTSLLRWRSSSPVNTSELPGEIVSTRRQRQLRRQLQLQRSTWDGSRDINNGNADVLAANGHADTSSVKELRLVSGSGSINEEERAQFSNVTQRDANDGLPASCQEDGSFCGRSDLHDNEDDDDSNIVELYLDSILEILPDKIGSDTPDEIDDSVGRGIGIDKGVDMDELLRLGEARDCDDTGKGDDLVELARGAKLDKDEECNKPIAAETAQTTVATTTPVPAVGVDMVDGRRRLSATGSEPATHEFRFIRARVLSPATLPTAASGSVTEATTPRLRRSSPPPLPKFRSNAASTIDSRGNSRRRFHWRRQSYLLSGWLKEQDKSEVVLTGARHSLATPPPSHHHHHKQQQQKQLPSQLQSTAQFPTPVRAVIFHPPSQSARATYLVNYLASSGQPACLWSDAAALEAERAPATAEPEAECKAQRRRGQLATRLRNSLLRRSRLSASVPVPTEALNACARHDYLPIVLLPACGQADDRYLSRLRESLAAQPRLTAGLVVVVAGPSEASHWAAAAGAETPTQVIRDEFTATAKDDSQESRRRQNRRPPGPECCRQVLAAARRSHTLASVQSVL